MGGGRRNGTTSSQKRKGNPLGCSEDITAFPSTITMPQVNALVMKNERSMQALIEGYRRTGSNTPLWLSSLPYYKKDSMIVVNLRDDRSPINVQESSETSSKIKINPNLDSKHTSSQNIRDTPHQNTSVTASKSDQSPVTESRSFVVSGGTAASKLGLRIGSDAEQWSSATENKDAQPEMAIVGNVKNLSGGVWDATGLDNILVGSAPVDPLTINSDPLWGAETDSLGGSDLELNNMLSVLKDLAPVNLDLGSSEVSSGFQCQAGPSLPISTVQPPYGSSSLHFTKEQHTFQFSAQVQNQPQPTLQSFTHAHVSQQQPTSQQLFYYAQHGGFPHTQTQAQFTLQQQMLTNLPSANPYTSVLSTQTNVHTQRLSGQQNYFVQPVAHGRSSVPSATHGQYMAQVGPLTGQQKTVRSGPSKNIQGLKTPNPNARPFQPPQDKRFNVEAIPFVPPSSR